MNIHFLCDFVRHETDPNHLPGQPEWTWEDEVDYFWKCAFGGVREPRRKHIPLESLGQLRLPIGEEYFKCQRRA